MHFGMTQYTLNCVSSLKGNQIIKFNFKRLHDYMLYALIDRSIT